MNADEFIWNSVMWKFLHLPSPPCEAALPGYGCARDATIVAISIMAKSIALEDAARAGLHVSF